jgi:hypothetical protein
VSTVSRISRLLSKDHEKPGDALETRNIEEFVEEVLHRLQQEGRLIDRRSALDLAYGLEKKKLSDLKGQAVALGASVADVIKRANTPGDYHLSAPYPDDRLEFTAKRSIMALIMSLTDEDMRRRPELELKEELMSFDLLSLRLQVRYQHSYNTHHMFCMGRSV